MRVRDGLRENPTAASLALLLLLASGALIYYFGLAGRPRSVHANRAFFSDDGGKTFFVDDVHQPSGFQHNGHPAYRAYVYQCGESSEFVGYLERTSPSPAGGPAAVPSPGSSDSAAGRPAQPVSPFTRQICKPGGNTWLSATDPGFVDVLRISCPSGGSDLPQPVEP